MQRALLGAAFAAASFTTAAAAAAAAADAPSFVYFNVTSPSWSVRIPVPFVANASLGGRMNAWRAMLETQRTSPERLVIHYAVIPPLNNRSMEIFVNGLGSTKDNLLACSLDGGGGAPGRRGPLGLRGGAAYCWSCADDNVTQNGTGINDMLLLPNDEVEWTWRCFGKCPNTTTS
jgi:hypothetical protein